MTTGVGSVQTRIEGRVKVAMRATNMLNESNEHAK